MPAFSPTAVVWLLCVSNAAEIWLAVSTAAAVIELVLVTRPKPCVACNLCVGKGFQTYVASVHSKRKHLRDWLFAGPLLGLCVLENTCTVCVTSYLWCIQCEFTVLDYLVLPITSLIKPDDSRLLRELDAKFIADLKREMVENPTTDVQPLICLAMLKPGE